MKTGDLIEALAANIEPVDPHAARRRILWATLAGVVIASPFTVWLLGLNPLLAEAARQPMFWVKFGYVATAAAAAGVVVTRLARPSADPRRAAVALTIPFFAMVLLAAFTLAGAGSDERTSLMLGSSWKTCSLSIAALSLPALATTLWAVRGLAPTRLRLAGAGAGLLAGALATFVYQFHCPELAAPFLASWYPLGMLAPAALGALVGPRVLAW